MGKRNIYVASSWRNTQVDEVVAKLREAGHEVYNFKEANSTFHWADLGDEIPELKDIAQEYILNPKVPASVHTDVHALGRVDRAYEDDFEALNESNTLILVLPCGNSAHLELGYALAQGQDCYILMTEPSTLDLMYHECLFFDSIEKFIGYIGEYTPEGFPTSGECP